MIDKEIEEYLDNELDRQKNGLELIASENYCSKDVREACGSIATFKYAEGIPGHRYYGGCEWIDKIEQTAIDRACELFHCKYANVQPHSGANANLAVMMALLKPGDTILSADLQDGGGHLSHGSKANISGKLFNIVPYGVNEDGWYDMDNIMEIAKECKPQMIIAGASAYSREIKYDEFRKIADEFGAYLMVDMAHVAGLVAAGLHMSPMEYADVVTTTTHKTLRGPRGGLILWNRDDLTRKINGAVFPGTQGGPLEHIIAAKAVCFKEAMTDEFKAYQFNVIDNAKMLAMAMEANGFKIVTGGTDNHMFLVDLTPFGITGKEFQERCDAVGITLNKNTIPGDKESPFVTSGCRIGTPAITTRGMGFNEMMGIAYCLSLVAKNEKLDDVKHFVKLICNEFPLEV